MNESHTEHYFGACDTVSRNGTRCGYGFSDEKGINPKVQKALLGFASGVMIAASVWSLILPSLDMAAENGGISWLPSAIGFLLGIGFLLLLDHIIPHLHINSDQPEGAKAKLEKSVMLMLAVTLHNIPEGMAVGVVFAGMASGITTITVAAAFALAIGIAADFQREYYFNAVRKGITKRKAFTYGVCRVWSNRSARSSPFSDLADYAGSAVILSFAAGAMFYLSLRS